MANLTPIFQQCVEIVQSEIKSIPPAKQKYPFVVNDKFANEASTFHHAVLEMGSFISQIKSPYLNMGEEQSLSVQDKNKIDEEFRYKTQQLFERLKYMQEYERKRQQLVATETSNKRSLFSKLFESEESDRDLYFTTLGNHRTQILKSLNNNLNHVSKQFDILQRKRMEREKQLHVLNFQNLEDEADSLDFNEYVEEEAPVLSQQQVQMLEEENHEFLDMKKSQLKSVEKLHTSMVDIMNMQNELSFQLETQSDQINSLLDNHSQMEADIKMGNKQLTSATGKNKRSANLLVALSLILAVLLLIIDAISF